MKTSTLIMPGELKKLKETHHTLCGVLSGLQTVIENGVDVASKTGRGVSNQDLIQAVHDSIPQALQVTKIEFHEGMPAQRLEPQLGFVIQNISFSRQVVSLSLGINGVWSSGPFVAVGIEPDDEGYAKFAVPSVVLGKSDTELVLFEHFNISRNYRLSFTLSSPTNIVSDWTLSELIDLTAS